MAKKSRAKFRPGRLAVAFLSGTLTLSSLGLAGIFALESANPEPWQKIKRAHCYYYVPETNFEKLGCITRNRTTVFDVFSARGLQAWRRTINAAQCARQFNAYDEHGKRVRHAPLSYKWRTEKAAKWHCLKSN